MGRLPNKRIFYEIDLFIIGRGHWSQLQEEVPLIVELLEITCTCTIQSNKVKCKLFGLLSVDNLSTKYMFICASCPYVHWLGLWVCQFCSIIQQIVQINYAQIILHEIILQVHGNCQCQGHQHCSTASHLGFIVLFDVSYPEETSSCGHNSSIHQHYPIFGCRICIIKATVLRIRAQHKAGSTSHGT